MALKAWINCPVSLPFAWNLFAREIVVRWTIPFCCLVLKEDKELKEKTQISNNFSNAILSYPCFLHCLTDTKEWVLRFISFFDLQSQDLTYKSIFYYLLFFFSKSYWNVENKTVSQKNVPVFNQLVDLNNVGLLEHKAL